MTPTKQKAADAPKLVKMEQSNYLSIRHERSQIFSKEQHPDPMKSLTGNGSMLGMYQQNSPGEAGRKTEG